jgi:hypothetical protein
MLASRAEKTIVARVMVGGVYGIVRVELAGNTSFALEVLRRQFIFVATATAHGTWCCFGHVRMAKGAKFAGHMFGVDSAVVVNVFASLTGMAGNVETEVCLGLVVTGGTNLTI